MLEKVLIANRGEIALRIIRACKELGIATVAVYSEADRDSLHVRFADEAVCIGPPAVGSSYLNIPRIISAAEVTASDAIHPGYGFLAENTSFAEICLANGVQFIGPSAQMISLMGDKAVAKVTMQKTGVPVIPGSDGNLEDVSQARRLAGEIGYPVMLKAAAGGGGRGMRIVREEGGVENAFDMARAEAEAGFGSGELYLEKYLDHPRHIEVQVLGDQYGEMIHLGERECSIQRRHQKLIEESPSPAVDTELRQQICQSAVTGAKSIGYQSAGTVEFLLDKDGNFYFMEMNTRIQVEHPVTELVSGIDLIKEQIRLAGGEPMRCRQSDIKLHGHAIECRINAEDPDKSFLPNPGHITSFHVPGGPGIRVDTHAYAGYEIPPYYDSLLAKVITHGSNREEALGRMERALEEFVVEGVKTTITFHQRVITNPDFRKGQFDTGFLERFG